MSDSIRDLHALIDRRIALSTGSAPPVELVRGVVARVDGTRCEAYLDGAASTTPGITVPRGVHTYPGDEVLVSRRRDGFLVISDVLDLSAVDVAPTVRVYTASAEWVKPERIHHIVVEVQGAGGGGGGTGWTNTNGSAESGGGGGGGYARKLLTAADLASASAATVTVGAVRTLEEIYDQSRKEGFGREVKRRIMLGTYVLSAGYQEAFYKKAQKVRTRIIEAFEQAFQRCDFIATPTTSGGAFPLDSVHDPLQLYLQDIFTVPANLAGLPSVSVPSGFDSQGHPLGLQLTGPQLQDVATLRAAHAYEQATRFTAQYPKAFA